MTLPTPTYNPITARRVMKKSQGAPYLAEVGADNGRIWGPPGWVYVREPLSYDLVTGQVTGGQTYLVRGHGSFLPNYGVKVWVEYVERYGEWMIVDTDPDGLMQQGIDPNILNQLNPSTKYVDTLQLLGGNPYPVSSGTTASTEIQFKNLHWLDYRGRHQLWSVDPFNRPDLSNYEPATETKRLVHFWARHDGTVSVSQGTAISKTLAFQADVHLTEVLEDRPDQLAIPLGAMVMGEGETSIGDDDRYPMDTRPWITNVKYAGFPNPVDKPYIVPTGVSEVVADKLTVTSKLTVEGNLTIDARQTTQAWSDHEPFSVAATTGNWASGTASDTQQMYDRFIRVEEVVGEPGFDIRFTFKGISTDLDRLPNFVVARWKYQGSKTHHITLDMWNYRTAAWDQVAKFNDNDGYYDRLTTYTPVGNRPDYVDNTGAAQMRFYHHTNGNPEHFIDIDYLALVHGTHK